ncbi:MAG: hypothetical protein P4L86_14885 [Mycobacterium sp.]|nr:hypothetical protein [Mycobacterium sp.]
MSRMFRVLTVAAAIAGMALGVGPAARAHPPQGGNHQNPPYPTHLPGQN